MKVNVVEGAKEERAKGDWKVNVDGWLEEVGYAYVIEVIEEYVDEVAQEKKGRRKYGW